LGQPLGTTANDSTWQIELEVVRPDLLSFNEPSHTANIGVVTAS
jgi:hypothetical protein